jgi:hypothetical protein
MIKAVRVVANLVMKRIGEGLRARRRPKSQQKGKHVSLYQHLLDLKVKLRPMQRLIPRRRDRAGRQVPDHLEEEKEGC